MLPVGTKKPVKKVFNKINKTIDKTRTIDYYFKPKQVQAPTPDAANEETDRSELGVASDDTRQPPIPIALTREKKHKRAYTVTAITQEEKDRRAQRKLEKQQEMDKLKLPPDSTEPSLFPKDEERKFKIVPYNGRTREVLVSGARRDGTLTGGCRNCTKTDLSMECFAPMESRNNNRRRPAFFEALDAFDYAYADGYLDEARKQRLLVEEFRHSRCFVCAPDPGDCSPKVQECKDEYTRMRKAACEANDGCANQECAMRGPEAWNVLQGDHEHTRRDPDPEKRKTVHLSAYVWWSGHGGVEAMRAEEAKGMQWICGFCHALEPSGKQANKYEDPATMPEGRQGIDATEEEVAQYHRRRHAKIRYPKQQYVDRIKREVFKCCGFCQRPVLEGEEHASIFDHIDPTTKIIGRDTPAGRKGGVAGLVANHSNAATLEKIEPVIDAEIPKCQLLCHNCNHRKEHYGLRGSNNAEAGPSGA